MSAYTSVTRQLFCWLSLGVFVALASACGAPVAAPATLPADTNTDAVSDVAALGAVELGEGERLHVVATTNIVADVVSRVGGSVDGDSAIELTGLLPVGADPHSYIIAPQDMRLLNEAHVIFVNGLGLEEGMASTLDSLDGGAAVVSVNQGVETIEFDGENHDEEHADEEHEGEEHADEEHADEEQADEEHESEEHEGEEHADEEHADEEHEHEHEGADPHTWTSVENVESWVGTIVETLSTLDPADAERYAASGASYLEELAALKDEIDEQIASLPAERRKLVTDHDSFGYFASEYEFEIVGTVIPGLSAAAEPSAQEIAQLTEQIRLEEVRAIFVGTTVNPGLAQQIADDTGVQVVPLYTGSLSDADGPAATYIELMRYNTRSIVSALQ